MKVEKIHHLNEEVNAKIRPTNILIIEDNDFEARLVEKALEYNHSDCEKYHCFKATSVAEGESIFHNEIIDAVVLDLMLPDSSGIDTVRKVLRFAKSQPVVVLTSLDDEDAGLRCIREGAQDYLVKGQSDLRLLRKLVTKAMGRERYRNDLNRAKNQAEAAVKLKDKFASLVMNDLKAPIASIQGILGIIKEDQINPLIPQHAKLIQNVMDNVELMTSLTNELLSMSRVHAGAIRPEKVFTDMSAITHHAISRFEGQAKRKKIEITDKTEFGQRVYTDPQLLELVVKQLISNSIKYCNEGGRIMIYSPKGRCSTLIVKDTGVGMAPEVAQTLFRDLERNISDGAIDESGDRLGLSFSSRIMSALLGKLEVKSTPGRGSEFSIILPDVKPKVLVVDCESSERCVLKKAMETIDVEVVEAEDGQSAIELLKEHIFHLITINIANRGMSGFDLLQHIRSRPKSRLIPVMMMTSDASDETRYKVYEMGANDLIKKPILKAEYISRAGNLLCGETVLASDILYTDQ